MATKWGYVAACVRGADEAIEALGHADDELGPIKVIILEDLRPVSARPE
jgi:hypothetical protein